MYGPEKTFGIADSTRRGYFRVVHRQSGAVVADGLLWHEALRCARAHEQRVPTVIPAREDGHGDD